MLLYSVAYTDGAMRMQMFTSKISNASARYMTEMGNFAAKKDEGELTFDYQNKMEARLTCFKCNLKQWVQPAALWECALCAELAC